MPEGSLAGLWPQTLSFVSNGFSPTGFLPNEPSFTPPLRSASPRGSERVSVCVRERERERERFLISENLRSHKLGSRCV